MQPFDTFITHATFRARRAVVARSHPEAQRRRTHSYTLAPSRGRGQRAGHLPLQAADRESRGLTKHHSGSTRTCRRNPGSVLHRIDPKRRLLFAGNCNSTNSKGQANGRCRAFSSMPTSGKIDAPQSAVPRWRGPCHLTLDKTGRNLLVANFNGGSAAVLPSRPYGRLGEATDFVQHTGKASIRTAEEPRTHTA